MAENLENKKINTQNDSTDEQETSLIDPIYEKFVGSVMKSIGSTDFYEYFMDALSRAHNEIQFSNRKMIKHIDLEWVDAIEDCLPAMQNIVSSPRNMIKDEDLIVNVANAKKPTSETVRHLAQHASLVEDFDESNGSVRPSKLMQRYREESLRLNENQLVFTTIEYAYRFVKIRHDALLEAMSDEFGAKLKVKSDMESATEHVHLDMFLHIKEIDDPLKTDNKNEETLSRISKIYRVLSMFMNTGFAQELSKQNRVKGTINKTNILKKNKNYSKVLKLFEFLRKYDQIGYTIQIKEQNPIVTEKLEQDIYNNILFNYLVLKGYLESEEDRKVETTQRVKGRKLKPKFIHQIVEELTEDYDLPDVEIRKVLIEELTKQQLMKEEEAERRRLVEEQAQRRKEEKERLAAEKKAEKERIRAEKKAERERIQQEKEEAEAKIREQEMFKMQDERRRTRLFSKEVEHFRENLQELLSAREEQNEKLTQVAAIEDYANAVEILESDQRRLFEEKEREKVRKIEERERLKAEEEAEKERILQEERAEAERIRMEAEAELARIHEEQRVEALSKLTIVLNELSYFNDNLENTKQKRQKAEQLIKARNERHTAEVMARRMSREQ